MLFRRRKQAKPEPVSETAAIEAAEFQLVFCRWKGTPIPIKLRKLSSAQIMACGEFSLIETDEYRRGAAKPTSWKRYTEYTGMAATICRAALVSPTYEQIFEAVGKKGLYPDLQRRWSELRDKIAIMQPGPARKEFEEKAEAIRVHLELILPEDFTTDIVTFAVDSNNETVKSLTSELLLQLAILAERGHDNPSDHVDGTLTQFHRNDIDRQAAVIYSSWLEEQRHHFGRKQ
jgi:hypothetical protein